jgi:hypothetical protein
MILPSGNAPWMGQSYRHGTSDEVREMASYYTFEFTDEKAYRVVEHFPWGEARIVPQDSHDLAAWIAQGNTPEKVSGDRFITIVNGEPVVDPKKDGILAKEAREQEINMLIQKKMIELALNQLVVEGKVTAEEKTTSLTKV